MDRVKEVVTRTLRMSIMWLGLASVCVVAAGCDKCGHRIDINTPSIQKACGDNAEAR